MSSGPGKNRLASLTSAGRPSESIAAARSPSRTAATRQSSRGSGRVGRAASMRSSRSPRLDPWRTPNWTFQSPMSARNRAATGPAIGQALTTRRRRAALLYHVLGVSLVCCGRGLTPRTRRAARRTLNDLGRSSWPLSAFGPFGGTAPGDRRSIIAGRGGYSVSTAVRRREGASPQHEEAGAAQRPARPPGPSDPPAREGTSWDSCMRHRRAPTRR